MIWINNVISSSADFGEMMKNRFMSYDELNGRLTVAGFRGSYLEEMEKVTETIC